MAKYRSWPFSVSEADMANIDRACADLGAQVGAKVSRSEFLRVAAATATSGSTAAEALRLFAQTMTSMRQQIDVLNKAASDVKKGLANLSPEQLAELQAQIEKMKAGE